ncbi:MAG: response regulator [Dehalococcoidia bacterium]
MTTARSVIVVDDDIDHALIVRLVLSRVVPDASIDVMTDPRALAQRLVEAPRDALVLMDRQLDGRDGIDLLPLLRAERPDLRTVLLSAALPEADRLRALAAGAYAATEKPGSLAGWQRLVESMVGADAQESARTHAA